MGVSNDGTRYLPLTERWNGSSWSVVSSPSFGTGDNALGGVVAVAANDVWAVGGYNTGGSVLSLVEHWDGAQWTQAPSENPGTADNSLFGVAAGGGNAWAVGSYRGSGPSQTLVERLASVPCLTSTVTATPQISHTPVAGTPTPTSTVTATPQLTLTPVSSSPTVSATASATVTPCTMPFIDVLPTDYFYEAVRYLYCEGAISGYGTVFLPYNLTTRGQLTKIVVLAEEWDIYTPPSPTYTDVPITHPFYTYIETAYHQGIISGYSCGTGCLEFRPGNNVTRGQLCKIIVLAEQWGIYTPPSPTFQDVPSSDTFYQFIETAYNHGIISGYTCGAGCLEFRPGASATRGQICKIVYNAVTAP